MSLNLPRIKSSNYLTFWFSAAERNSAGGIWRTEESRQRGLAWSPTSMPQCGASGLWVSPRTSPNLRGLQVKVRAHENGEMEEVRVRKFSHNVLREGQCWRSVWGILSHSWQGWYRRKVTVMLTNIHIQSHFPGYTQQLHHLVCLGHSGDTSLLYCEQSGHVIVSQVVWDTGPSA